VTNGRVVFRAAWAASDGLGAEVVVRARLDVLVPPGSAQQTGRTTVRRKRIAAC
jgi:hypothetical protein